METVSGLGLKRRFEEVDSGSPCSMLKVSDDDVSSSDSVDSCDSLNAPSSSLTPTSILRRQKTSLGHKRVRFDAVTVYYFSRRQGFTSVPSQGGSSLGMARHHCAIRQYTLGEFAREQESSHRNILRQHLRQEKLNARKMKLTRNGTVHCAQADLLTLDDVSDEDLNVEGVEVDDCFFLQPLPTKRRRALLRASGIARIDAREKMELRAIRLSREECGCDCRFYCDPHQCGCSRAGIKCQVDRMSFPCGCSRDGCHNAAGRIEFNPVRVRTHFLHTIMKLDREKRHLLGSRFGEDFKKETELTTLPSCGRSSMDLGVEVKSEALNEQEILEEQCHSLEHENETAVLHLQSAEEQERRREREEEEAHREEVQSPKLCLLHEELSSQEEAGSMVAVDQMFFQDTFQGGATLLCIKKNQEDALSLNEPSSVFYYQIDHVENAAFKIHHKQEEESRKGKEPQGGQEEGEARGKCHNTQTCMQDHAESSTFEQPSPSCPESIKGAEEGHSISEHGHSSTDFQETYPLIEDEEIKLPSEV
ncbi:cysteine/serine-rich nuclear protein 2 isoform X2 [Tachysurus fulvidraco]|nr:cysteine/serine-rich nuclear protein 2 isoform X2 [Tachysurus fulvidraco]XP_027000542.1 cysteine/serine-rich nuclear protein 2 isoform X2 [Tachysurus fulvidraco]XP_027000543.1 cysteine/serine-rich nuclear protein 2 isoform X2 [Tachysurus fulvidraco]XP_027000544.1 cysteine/serine-rich nuclear protein 2 isoform X2 [Tachysurus fulvidraco]XP_027000545.1 cysteine/serine-rich nuclear protein 2 isoform X2 [Tachysurus fulvidraco]